MISEFVIDAILCSGLAEEEKSSLGVIAGGRMELLSGLGAVEGVVAAVVVGAGVPGSCFGRTKLNALECLNASSLALVESLVF